ncbi:MAG: hypothetical protein FWD22_01965 [Treponema sp.]|nr:hypothetical protein [Treponema sp.]
MRSVKILFVGCLLLVNSYMLFADFSLRIAPVVEAPVGLSQFGAGFGASASLDWSVFSFLKIFEIGLSAGGGFSSIPVQTGDPLTLLEGRGGPILRARPFDRWTFQAGFYGGAYQYSRTGENETKALYGGALGAQFHLLPYLGIYAEGGYNHRVFSPQSPFSSLGINLGVSFNLTEIMGGRTRVQVEKTEQFRVFPVSWAWYENNPVATIKITNEEPNLITDISFSFFMESYMSRPWVFADNLQLASGESIEIPVTALFNESMLGLTETVNANGEIQVQYRSLGARKQSFYPIQMPIFHRNTLSWDDDRRAAAFVSPRDSAARLFARYVAAAVDAREYPGNVPSNVRYAVALFEALRLYGISYVVVPATSFVTVSSDESVLDNVSYPYQALYYRGGDCSYLSILFCSLLEALNIESAFITIPGHIYVAFEVGDTTWRAGNADIIELEMDGVKKRWLPVEITVPEEGFTRAWRIGARQWRNSGNDAALYSIRDSWQVYPSVTVPASGDQLPIMPSRDEIIRAMERELR